MDTSSPMESFDKKLQVLDDAAFLGILKRSDIELRVVQGQLRVNATPGALNEELKAELRRRKESLLVLLQNRSNPINDLRKNNLGIEARKRLSPAGQWTPQLQYWKTQLDGVASFLQLPSRRSTATSAPAESSTASFSIPPAVVASLRSVGTAEQSSFETIMLTAFSLLLSRYADKEDFCIGVPVMRKQRHNESVLEDTIENFVPIRCRLDFSKSFLDLLRVSNKTILEVYENSSIPLSRLLGELPISVEQGRHPLFQFAVAFDFSRKNKCLVLVPDQIDDFGFDLSLYLTHYSDADISGCFRYRADLFSDQSVALFIESFNALLGSIAENPNCPIGELSILSAAQREQILVQWNQTQMEFPAAAIHSMFEHQVELNPESIAVVSGRRAVSYFELNVRANLIAHCLLQRGVQAGDIVGICMRRSVDMIATMLAVLKVGAAYLPLDPAYPAQRLDVMLEDSRAKIVVSNDEHANVFVRECEIIWLDREASAITKLPRLNPEIKVSSIDLAYVIYTSGSTGRPKGVAIEHRSTMSLLSWAKKNFSSEERAKIFASTSICFDLSVFEIFLPLTTGTTVILVDDLLQLAQIDVSSQPTLINTVPSVIGAFIASQKIPRSVLCVNLAGELLSVSLVKKLEQQLPDARIFDLYGPTETTTYSTFCTRRSISPATIGRPLANTKIYLLDARHQPVPPEVPGQIFIGGEGVARGYIHQPDLTEDRFVTMEHLPDAGRLYSTGDLGLYKADGSIEYLGRIDQQVKIRGFRVELGEIEGILLQYPRVREAVVLMHQGDIASGASLRAYVTVSASPVEDKDLIAFQEKFLPSYMVAREILILESLPVTPNGKVDKRALANAKPTVSAYSTQESKPATEIERKLVAIWEQNFKRTPIGRDDDFFSLGGHSLLAFQIFNDIEKQLKVALMLSVLFKAPTIRLLAEEIERKEKPRSRFALH